MKKHVILRLESGQSIGIVTEHTVPDTVARYLDKPMRGKSTGDIPSRVVSVEFREPFRFSWNGSPAELVSVQSSQAAPGAKVQPGSIPLARIIVHYSFGMTLNTSVDYDPSLFPEPPGDESSDE